MENPNEPATIITGATNNSDEQATGNNGGSDSQTSSGDGSTVSALDPADAIAPAKRRGRPPGGKNRPRESSDGIDGNTDGNDSRNSSAGNDAKTRQKKIPLDVDGLAIQLQGVHKLCALGFKNSTYEITVDESKKLASALVDVAKQYDLKLNPEVLAWLKLLGVSVAIYGPRVGFNIMAKKQATARAMQESNLQSAGQQSNAPSAGGQQNVDAANAATISLGIYKFQ